MSDNNPNMKSDELNKTPDSLSVEKSVENSIDKSAENAVDNLIDKSAENSVDNSIETLSANSESTNSEPTEYSLDVMDSVNTLDDNSIDQFGSTLPFSQELNNGQPAEFFTQATVVSDSLPWEIQRDSIKGIPINSGVSPDVPPTSIFPPGGILSNGTKLGHFQISGLIGGGGMGKVYEAIDLALDRKVAIKTLSLGRTQDSGLVARFMNEARSAARLNHEHIAQVYFAGEENGLPYIAFEFVQGINIRDFVMENGPLSLPDALNYILQMVGAIAHASSHGVIHRDVKPSNIMITSHGKAKLIDMGLARLLKPNLENSELTASGVTLGTFDYISPEQARDPRNADVRSDIYSLGCTFFFMLTGQPPFPEGTVLQKLLQHQGDSPPDVREFVPQIPAEVALLIQKMMAKDPKNRFQTPEPLTAVLVEIANGIGLRPTSPGQTVWALPPVPKRLRIYRHLPWITAVLFLGTALIFFRLTDNPENGISELPSFDQEENRPGSNLSELSGQNTLELDPNALSTSTDTKYVGTQTPDGTKETDVSVSEPPVEENPPALVSCVILQDNNLFRFKYDFLQGFQRKDRIWNASVQSYQVKDIPPFYQITSFSSRQPSSPLSFLPDISAPSVLGVRSGAELLLPGVQRQDIGSGTDEHQTSVSSNPLFPALSGEELVQSMTGRSSQELLNSSERFGIFCSEPSFVNISLSSGLIPSNFDAAGSGNPPQTEVSRSDGNLTKLPSSVSTENTGSAAFASAVPVQAAGLDAVLLDSRTVFEKSPFSLETPDVQTLNRLLLIGDSRTALVSCGNIPYFRNRGVEQSTALPAAEKQASVIQIDPTGKAGTYPSLNAALTAVLKNGNTDNSDTDNELVIELQFNGKMDVQPITFNHRKIKIIAGTNFHPVLNFKTALETGIVLSRSLFLLNGGYLTLQNLEIEFTVPSGDDFVSSEWSLFEFADLAQLSLQDVVLTISNAVSKEDARPSHPNVAFFKNSVSGSNGYLSSNSPRISSDRNSSGFDSSLLSRMKNSDNSKNSKYLGFSEQTDVRQAFFRGLSENSSDLTLIHPTSAWISDLQLPTLTSATEQTHQTLSSSELEGLENSSALLFSPSTSPLLPEQASMTAVAPQTNEIPTEKIIRPTFLLEHVFIRGEAILLNESGSRRAVFNMNNSVVVSSCPLLHMEEDQYLSWVQERTEMTLTQNILLFRQASLVKHVQSGAGMYPFPAKITLKDSLLLLDKLPIADYSGEMGATDMDVIFSWNSVNSLFYNVSDIWQLKNWGQTELIAKKSISVPFEMQTTDRFSPTALTQWKMVLPHLVSKPEIDSFLFQPIYLSEIQMPNLKQLLDILSLRALNLPVTPVVSP